MAVAKLYAQITVSPWARICLWCLCKIGWVAVPLIGESPILRAAAWIFTKGHKVEITDSKA